MINRKLFCAVFLIALTGVQCKKQSENSPCAGQLPYKADFGIYIRAPFSSAPSGDTLIELKDNGFCLGGYVNFSVKTGTTFLSSFDSLRWVVGNTQNTSTQREYQLLFNLPETDIDVQLTGYKKASPLNCFPSVPDVQTVRKTFSVVAPGNNIPIAGDFWGYHTDNPNDTFTVSVRFEPDRNWLVMKNLPKGNMGYPFGVLPPPIQANVGIAPKYYGYDYILLDSENGLTSTPGFGPLNGVASMLSPDRMQIVYRQFMSKDATGRWINARQRTFVGVRK
jgi:hypothetical protein